jgi:hypothetical protein
MSKSIPLLRAKGKGKTRREDRKRRGKKRGSLVASLWHIALCLGEQDDPSISLDGASLVLF